MVKTTAAREALPVLPAALAALLLLQGCAAGRTVNLHPQVLTLSAEAGGSVSVVPVGSSLVTVFSRRPSATLETASVDAAGPLPASAPVPSVIDIVDVVPPLPGDLGDHVLISRSGTATLLYRDRLRTDQQALKVATRSPGEDGWTVDVIDPPGDPLGAITADLGKRDLFWANGSLLWRRLPGTSPTAILLPSFVSSGRPVDLADRGFAARNERDGLVYVISGSAGSYSARSVGPASAVFGAALRTDGRAAIATWDRATRRLVLREETAPGGPLKESIVTLSDGTTSVSVLVTGAGDLLFVFDEAVRRSGRTIHDVSLLAPAAVMGVPGRGYRKAVLIETSSPVISVAAATAAGSLDVVVQSDAVRLVRAPLRGLTDPLP
jgi:hypothetical protein